MIQEMGYSHITHINIYISKYIYVCNTDWEQTIYLQKRA